MLLHHFTSREALVQILESGLVRGSVPVSRTRTLDAVWLTTDPGPAGHGLEAGGAAMTDHHLQQAYEWSGVRPPPGTRFPKNANVRITVDLAATDRNLHEWLPWARRHLAADCLALVHPVGSDLRKARTWRLYFGAIPPADFVAVETAL